MVIVSGPLKVSRFKIPSLTSSTFLLQHEKSKDCYLVDSGSVEPSLKIIRSEELILKGIFLTHCHYDHIYQLNLAITNFPEVMVYGSEEALKGMKSSKINLSFYHEEPIEVQLCKEQPLKKGAGEVCLFEDYSLSYFSTRGHSADSMSYEVKNVLFTGDALIPGIETVTKLKGGDREKAKESEAVIMEKIKPSTILCAGHGPIFSYGDLALLAGSHNDN